MLDIQSATAENRRGKKKERRKKQDENVTYASATQGGHNKLSRRTALGLYEMEHEEPSATEHNAQISTGFELLYTSARFTTMS